MGESTPHAVVAKMLKFNLRDGIAEQISCPTLVLDAEEDMYLKGQPDVLYEHLTCPKTMIRFTTAEGAGAHCQCGADRLAMLAFLTGWMTRLAARANLRAETKRPERINGRTLSELYPGRSAAKADRSTENQTQVTCLNFILKQKGSGMSNQSTLNAPQLSGKSGARQRHPESQHPSKTETDPRLDPRIKKLFAGMPERAEKPNVSSREELLAQENSPAALAALDRQTALFDSMDSEEIAPSAGLSVRVETLTSSPDGNTINIRYVRPDNDEILPCVYYIHGGRMEMSSCFEGNYRTWARMIAAKGVAVAMVEFRNSVHPSYVPEIAPFPAGPNDCISGLKWVHANSTTLKIDAKRVIVAGESGGGNLVLAVGKSAFADEAAALVIAYIQRHRRQP